jgi:hypothetical protein
MGEVDGDKNGVRLPLAAPLGGMAAPAVVWVRAALHPLSRRGMAARSARCLQLRACAKCRVLTQTKLKSASFALFLHLTPICAHPPLTPVQSAGCPPSAQRFTPPACVCGAYPALRHGQAGPAAAGVSSGVRSGPVNTSNFPKSSFRPITEPHSQICSPSAAS